MNFFSKLVVIALIILAIMYVKDNFTTDSDNVIFNHKNNKLETPKNTPLDENIENEDKIEKQEPKTLVQVYYTNSTSGALQKISKELPNDQDKLYFAIKELLKGPDFKDKNKGYSSEIPKGTKLLNLKDEGSLIIIDVSDEFQYGGGTESQYTRLEQLIKTVLAQKPSKPVYLYINGHKADAIGGEGIIITQPLSENSLNG